MSPSHENVDLSVHWLPAYTNTAFAMLSSFDANPCVSVKLGLPSVGATGILILEFMKK